MPKVRNQKNTVRASFRIDPELYQLAENVAARDDIDFSKYVRRLIRRDLNHGTKRPEPARNN